ncbi:MAG TPA: SusD/RagB family nutrient-binding outer membrane lipoprotein [Lutibacter sp.]
MKKIAILILSLLFVLSCTDNLEDLNVDTKHAAEAEAAPFLTSAQKNMTDLMSNLNVNRNNLRQWVQHVSTTTYHDEAWYNITNRKVPDGLWANIYRDVLKDLDESAKMVTKAAPAPLGIGGTQVQKNQNAILEVMNVYAYSLLVETFGDVPYTEALDITNVIPKYDDGKTVYKDLILRLSAAINSMADDDSFGSADIIYAGDMVKWKKFANSLKLRMGLRIYDTDPIVGADAVKSAVLSGVFTSNADNAVFQYLNTTPNTNKMWEDLVQSGRKDYVAANTLVDAMNDLNDPRRAVYFQLYEGIYKGGVYATSNSKYNANSILGEIFHEPDLPQIHMDYSSVKFFLAEAAERSIVGTPAAAAAHYNEAITASFDYYGVSGAATYLLQPSVAYATATGTWKQKIGTQKWIALYNQGYEAWAEYRRLDFPVLTAPPGAVADSGGKVPVRYTYPIGEQTKNGANYTAAASAVGGDKLTTKLFWDKF